jgi:hypothetical protein
MIMLVAVKKYRQNLSLGVTAAFKRELKVPTKLTAKNGGKIASSEHS